MKVLHSWLGEYLDLSRHSLDQVVDALAALGLPVDDFVRSGTVPGIVTATGPAAAPAVASLPQFRADQPVRETAEAPRSGTRDSHL